MKLSIVMAIVVLTGAVYWFTGGGQMLLRNWTGDLPDTIEPTNATFFGNEQTNPYVD
ncbi:MAG: hypothetical protein AAGG48_06525 [Planctomycetota bacterium]